jgi:hypothetical protein
VGGWLLVFCIFLTILRPLTFIPIVVRLIQVLVGHGSLARREAAAVYLLINSALVALSIAAGLRLWQVKPRAVQWAKAVLLISEATSIATWLGTNFAAKHYRATLPNSYFGGMGMVLMWFLYLSISVRVRNTYRDSQL